MSRAFTPPDTFSQDDISTLANVRRALWINGLFGLGAGSVIGMGGHIILQSLQKKYVSVDGSSSSSSTVASKGKVASSSTNSWIYKCLKPLPPLGRNTFLLSLLGGGALGSFVLSSTAGECTLQIQRLQFCVGVGETTNDKVDTHHRSECHVNFLHRNRSKQCSCTTPNLQFGKERKCW